MRGFIFYLILFSTTATYAQLDKVDTLVDVGGYQLRFIIIKGSGTPILFESGAGDGAAVWRDILLPIHEITGATLITYDRAGFGKSEINPKIKTEDGHDILDGIQALEEGLKKLGYFDKVVLVSHSYGGFYTTLFSARNPKLVKYNVRIDANLVGQYTDEILRKIESENVPPKTDETIGIYYLVKNYSNTVRQLRAIDFPSQIPVIDIWSPVQRHQTDEEFALLIKTHEDFVAAAANRIGIVAEGSGHYIFRDNPGLVISAITKAYIATLTDSSTKLQILEKALALSMDLFIEAQKTKE